MNQISLVKKLTKEVQYDQNMMKIFLYWVLQRQKIHYKKQILKENYPWTQDVLLRERSFTNVRRKTDKVSRFVVENICQNEELTIYDKLINILYFRFINKPQTYIRLGLPLRYQQLKNKQFNHIYTIIKESVQNIIKDNPNYKWYRTAYRNCGTTGAFTKRHRDSIAQNCDCKQTILSLLFVVWLSVKENRIEQIINTIKLSSNKTDVFEKILNIFGLSDFTGYQMFLDMTYIQQLNLTQNDFVVTGPGSLKGISFLFPNNNIVIKEKFVLIYWLQENLNNLINKYFDNIDLSYYSQILKEGKFYISLSNIQNCLCEFSKYIQYTNNDKYRHRKYKYTGENYGK